MLNEPVRYVDHLNIWHRESEQRTKLAAKKFISQYSAVLRVVLKLSEVVVIVGSAEQISLSSPTHFPDVLHGVKRSMAFHESLLLTSYWEMDVMWNGACVVFSVFRVTGLV